MKLFLPIQIDFPLPQRRKFFDRTPAQALRAIWGKKVTFNEVLCSYIKLKSLHHPNWDDHAQFNIVAEDYMAIHDINDWPVLEQQIVSALSQGTAGHDPIPSSVQQDLPSCGA